MFFQDEIPSPLGEDVYIRLPETIPNSRLATIAPPRPLEMLFGFPLRFALEALNHDSAYGSPAAGGSLGFADPVAGVGYAYVTSQMGRVLTGDPRDVALRDALYSALEKQETRPVVRACASPPD